MASVEGTLEVRQSRGDLPRQWTVLYCRLFRDGIKYYNSERDKKEIGAILLNQIEEVQNLEDKKKSDSDPPTFEVRSIDKGRTQHRCPDSKTLQLWVYKIDMAKTAEADATRSLQSPPKQDTTTSSDDEDDVAQIISPSGTMVLKKADIKLGQSTDSADSRQSDSSSGAEKRDKKKSKGSRKGKVSSPKIARAAVAAANVHSRTASADTAGEDDEEVDYSSMGTMQIHSSSTVEVKNTSELFFQHVADMKLKDRIRVWDEFPTEELQAKLDGGLQKDYEEEYTELLKTYTERRAQLLEQLRDLELKEVQQRFDTETSTTKTRAEDLKKRMMENFWSEQEAEEWTQILAEGETEYWEKLKSPDWKLSMDKDGVQVYRMGWKKRPVDCFRGELILDETMDTAVEAFGNYTIRKRWDPAVDEYKSMGKISDSVSIAYLKMKPSLGGIVSSRDFTDARLDKRVKKKDEWYNLSIQTTVKVKKQPSYIKGSVRGQSWESGVLVRGIKDETTGKWLKNKCHVTMMMQTDPCGWLPHSVVNQAISPEIHRLFHYLTDMLKNHREMLDVSEDKSSD